MDRHTRRKLFIFVLIVLVGYVGFFEVLHPEKGYIRKVYEEKVLGVSRSDLDNPVQEESNSTSEEGGGQIYYTLAPNNQSRDKVIDLMEGKE